jgi:hypothetical protein
VILLRNFRLDCSNDWMITGDFLWFRPARLSAATTLRSSGSPCCSWNVGCLVSGTRRRQRTALAAFLLDEIEHLVERRDLELAVELGRALGRQRLDRAERADLLEREVRREVVRDGGAVDHVRALAAGGELRGDVGGAADVRLVRAIR